MDANVTRFAASVRKEFDAQDILLFGSRARGDHLKDSDYDFIIVSKDFEEIDFLDRIKQVLKKTQATIHADILCFTPSEFEAKKKQIGTIRTAAHEAIPV